MAKSITTTLGNIQHHNFYFYHVKEWQKLLDGLNKTGDEHFEVKFSTIMELTNPSFTFWCLNSLTGHEDKLCELTSDIVERKTWRQRDREFPDGDAPTERNEYVKEMFDAIRKGNYFPDIKAALDEQVALNIGDIHQGNNFNLRNGDEMKCFIDIVNTEWKWMGEQLLKYFG